MLFHQIANNINLGFVVQAIKVLEAQILRRNCTHPSVFQAHYDAFSDTFYIAAGHSDKRRNYMSIWRAEAGRWRAGINQTCTDCIDFQLYRPTILSLLESTSDGLKGITWHVRERLQYGSLIIICAARRFFRYALFALQVIATTLVVGLFMFQLGWLNDLYYWKLA